MVEYLLICMHDRCLQGGVFCISANQLDMDARAFVLKISCWVLCAVEALATISNAIVGLCGRGVALSEFGSFFFRRNLSQDAVRR